MTATVTHARPLARGPRRRRLAAAVMVAALAVSAVTIVATRPRQPALRRAESTLLDDHRFTNGPKAGLAFAELSHLLLTDGDACRHTHAGADPRCDARLSAAAYAGVTAYVVAGCTAPGVYRARSGTLDYIRAIAAFDRRPLGTTPVPSPPAIPTC